MSQQDSTEYSLEIAHILFMDVISYSLLGMDRQNEVVRELHAIVRANADFQKAHQSGELVSLPTGDGMALVFFRDPLAPVRCAIHVDGQVKAGTGFELRMGIHTGLVSRVADINAQQNVLGGGINMAQRVMDCGDAGHILLSRAAAENLNELSAWRPLLKDLGDVQVKHGVLLRVFNLFNEDFGNSRIPAKLWTNSRRGEQPKNEEQSNPYDPWTPATPPAFIGRTVLLRRLEAALDEGRSVSLVGDWRIGKTSVLNTCFQRLQCAGRTIRLLNGKSQEGASPAAFVEHATGVRTGGASDAAADALSAWAKRESKPGLQPVLLLDEFDSMVIRFDYRFFERLRGMLDTLCVLAVSRREIDRVYRDDTGRLSPFHNRLELMWLGLLETEAADELIARGRVLPPEAHARIREWAGRHPFFIQLFGRKLMDSRRFGLSMDDAEDGFLLEGEARLRELWDTLPEADRQILRAAVDSPQEKARHLRRRGLLGEDGQLFGRVFAEWLRESNQQSVHS